MNTVSSCNCQGTQKTLQTMVPLTLAVPSVPVQPYEQPYDPATALKQGTMFPSLDLPFYVTGGETCGR